MDLSMNVGVDWQVNSVLTFGSSLPELEERLEVVNEDETDCSYTLALIEKTILTIQTAGTEMTEMLQFFQNMYQNGENTDIGLRLMIEESQAGLSDLEATLADFQREKNSILERIVIFRRVKDSFQLLVGQYDQTMEVIRLRNTFLEAIGLEYSAIEIVFQKNFMAFEQLKLNYGEAIAVLPCE